MRVLEGAAARSEVGLVKYQTNILGTRGPRRMTALIPMLDSNGDIPYVAENDGSMTQRCAKIEKGFLWPGCILPSTY